MPYPGRGTAAAERHLRWLLRTGGTVAALAGMHTVLAGGRSFPPWELSDPPVESELRYYAGFYAAFGAFALRTAARKRVDAGEVRSVGSALLLAGFGRAAGWRRVGRPHPLQQVLLAIELTLPVALFHESRGLT